ncbi:YhcN/YlaJ family sporulation lipoprotein [Ornithinibacillus halophilus]|uniref:Sporulation lipoprotein YhcN/YlaJ (Spore_YhcN_YlaJ) n=1 Tax=Ornithinibacillus halophilus TaxID=930117 RepID=A0A1M5DFL3_9BACI|nr:YhcN/YlaJ family sporulation lipoprotein [Ornithinibacillus halophilus]SHF65838.1 Sporulation lipoprotein YhcN/YlaJ (Spore_YhcN_YlaJ) [Ornithinibacillus halophilus]
MQRLLFIIGSLVLLSACNTTDDASPERNGQDHNNIQPIRYETEDDREQKDIGQRGGYPQSELNGLHDDGVNEKTRDQFFTEEAQEISDHLHQRKDIKQAQVAITDDRVVVAVTLNEYLEHHEISRDIEKDVRKFVDDKAIVVYTDDYYWKRMKNLNARQSNFGEEMDEFLENFFNTDD